MNDQAEKAMTSFWEARSRFFAAMNDAATAMARVTEADEHIRTFERRIKEAEAEAVVNGEIVGKNEAERAAAKVVWAANSGAVTAALEKQGYWIVVKAEGGALRDIYANQMSLARREMDMSIATINYIASAQRGEGATE